MNIDHIGIVTEDSTLLSNMLQKYFNGQAGKEVVDEEGFISQFISLENGSIEILQPTKKESVISRFLENTGGGLHHISIKVENIEDTVKRMKDDKYEFINNIGLYDKGDRKLKYIFLNPKYSNKILIELHEEIK
ncbi:VOC family protein [Wukongibacter sp. M2B1]|uniref:VOC family protein n=1 Tax=Wukongibacter sp. M2B1 TaxID=3088895 RepID=UPI003D7A83F6